MGRSWRTRGRGAAAGTVAAGDDSRVVVIVVLHGGSWRVQDRTMECAAPGSKLAYAVAALRLRDGLRRVRERRDETDKSLLE